MILFLTRLPLFRLTSVRLTCSLAMTPNPSQWAVPVGIILGGPIGLYLTLLFFGGFPFFQRHFFYAHRLNTVFWHDLNEAEYWGFARNQVTPFTLQSGNEALYAWHILPLRSVLEHEDELSIAPTGFANDITETESFKILKRDPAARLVISFHGNAGHIAQNLRTEHFHTLTDTSTFHVLSIDYRGYGRSTGFPSESGLIQDGITAVDWATNVAGVPPERIVLVGHSLGTAVTSGVVEYFATIGVEFAGVILIAGFSNVPTLLSSYRGAGFIPILSPLRPIPSLLRFFQSFIVDKWESASRLAEIVRLTRTRLRLTLIHAKNDMEIPCHESDALFKSAANATISQALDDESFLSWKNQRSTIHGEGTCTTIVTAEPGIIIRQELVPYGGHNKVTISSAVPLAVMRAFSKD
ncbi:alpha/beta-hydrolase [Xylaria venustula]|nr:alpha/beta-hydrolase [Xylaria venustula]